MDRTYDVYEVAADPGTGEWLGEPVATGRTVTASDWAEMVDTEAEHCDTYEHFPLDADGARALDGTTRAIIVRWAG